MFDLNAILDDVRSKYYCSKTKKRPTISWSHDYWTDFFGVYTPYNNHITISHILNDKRVTHEMIASVVYHESLHQDYPEHNRSFNVKADIFPNYSDLLQALTEYSELIHSEIVYPEGYNSFTSNKKQVVYILLPYSSKYDTALFSRDGQILMDFDSNVTFPINDTPSETLYVFLAESKKQYWIVGWCVNGTLLKRKKVENLSAFGDYDVSFQLVCEYKSIFLLPVSTCTYAIKIDDMGSDFGVNHICQYSINEPEIQGDLNYIESYCEGYMSLGFDSKNISCKLAYEDIPISKIKKTKESSYAEVWKANYIVDKEPIAENYLYRGNCKRNAWLNSSAFEDYKTLLTLEQDNLICAREIIKLCAVLSRFDDGKLYISEYGKLLSQEDTHLKNAISYILRASEEKSTKI